MSVQLGKGKLKQRTVNEIQVQKMVYLHGGDICLLVSRRVHGLV